MGCADWLPARLIVLASVLGCGGTDNVNSPAYLDTASSNAVIVNATGGSSKGASENDQSIKLSPANPAINRHIVYNADVAVEVGDLDKLTAQLNEQLRELKGFVSNFSEHRQEGNRRTATWTIRIDATKFLDFLQWLDEESNVVRKQLTSKDVTEEFVDLNARLTNKQATEKRLTKLQEEKSGKLDEVLAFEKEIDRTREEIERIEGKLRLLRDQLALSTITLTASTRVEYSPPKPANLATSISETWGQSVGNLNDFCKLLLLGFIGLVPWLPLAAVIAGLCWFAKKAWPQESKTDTQSIS